MKARAGRLRRKYRKLRRHEYAQLSNIVKIARAAIRPWPHFMIIGASRCGTTSLFDYICRHPDVSPPVKKELDFFNTQAFRRTMGHTEYKLSLGTGFTGEATPSYLCSPVAPQRIASVDSRVQLIVMLRNPTERAYSHYKLNPNYEYEGTSFDEAVARDIDRFKRGEPLVQDDLVARNDLRRSFVGRGLYAMQLATWGRYFKSSQFLLVKSEDFYADPRAVYADVLRFLGLRPWQLEEYPVLEGTRGGGMSEVARRALDDFYRQPNIDLERLCGISW